MIFGHGIDALGCVLDAGESLDVVQRKVGGGGCLVSLFDSLCSVS
jgi:hypothetical protein